MVSFITKLKTFARLVQRSFRYRRVYRTFHDRLDAFVLRIAATPIGPRLFSRRDYLLGLSELPDPIRLRRASSDFSIVEDIFEDREYELVRGYLKPDARIFDFGGNIGLSALFFSVLAPRSTIVVAEPDRTNLEFLRTNCAALIQSGRVRAEEAFVAAQDGYAGIDRHGESWEFKKIEAGIDGERVPCISVSTLLLKHGFAQIDLLKCDIEGSEAELFADCSDWIGRVECLLIETHAPYTLDDLYSNLRRAGWSFEILHQRPNGDFSLSFLRRSK